LGSFSILQKNYISKGPDETMEIGFRLGSLLRPGDIVGLYGELGAGKTTMVKGIARALGINEREIVSASFTIITEYDSYPPFTHIDLYRIERSNELDELGLWDHLGGEHISVIEWAEKAEGVLPEDTVMVKIKSVDEETREITIEGLHEKDRDNL